MLEFGVGTGFVQIMVRRVQGISFSKIYGNNDMALLRCKTCGHCKRESRMPFFDLNTPMSKALRTLALLNEEGCIRGVAGAIGHDKNAICKWVELAGSHCKEVTDYYLNEPHLNCVQVDEIWLYKKKRRRYDNDSVECGDAYSLIAMKTDTKLFIMRETERPMLY